jgi:mRNA interferase MazF
MVKQGDIIMINFNPRIGHEQAGYRPAVVISNNFYNEKTQLAMICPITNADSNFPTHIKLDSHAQTTGFVLCEHIHSFDINKRGYKFVERISSEMLEKILDVIFLEIKIDED